MNADQIPTALRSRPQWVLWKTAKRNSTAKPTKLPFQVNGDLAKANDPTTWNTFAAVLKRFQKGRYSGIGYQFTEDDGLVGIDLDGCRDPDTQKIATWAIDIGKQLDTYAEISPSGTGIKLFAIGKTPWQSGRKLELTETAICSKAPGIEVYDRLRYFAVTGRRLKGPHEPQERQTQLDQLFERFWPNQAELTHQTEFRSTEAVIERARAYVSKMPGAVSGSSGHNTTFAVACALAIGFDLPESEARALLAEYNQRCDPPWSEKELQHKIDSAYQQPGERGYLRNASPNRWESMKLPEFVWRGSNGSGGPGEGGPDENGEDDLTGMLADHEIANAVEVPNGDGKLTIPLPMEVIVERIRKQTDDWPRRVGTNLFVHDREQFGDEPFIMLKPTQLFAWAHSAGTVKWHRGAAMVTKEEFFENLRTSVTQYSIIESYPHFPPLRGHYYLRDAGEPGDGSALAGLLEMFTPATMLDGDLIKAAILTCFWGGPLGARPVFLITSESGQGSGKTEVAKKIGLLTGGAFQISHGESVESMKKRLLTTEALRKRICLVDNIKTTRFSWADFESLITSDLISGHQLYVGERDRPNNLTWLLTINGPSLSRDMAQRVIPIHLGAPTYGAAWERAILAYIEKNHAAIVADIAAEFAEKPKQIGISSRWGTWEAEVLARLADPTEAQAVIKERQSSLDADTDDSEQFEEYVDAKIKELNYSASDRVHIPNTTAVHWYEAALEEKITTTKFTRLLKQWVGTRMVKNLVTNPSRKQGRGIVWSGASALPGDEILYDLAQRLDWSSSGYRKDFE